MVDERLIKLATFSSFMTAPAIRVILNATLEIAFGS
jgi:hypothetical protein